MSSSPSPIILASQSPRRRELLTQAGYQFQVIPPSELAENGMCGDVPPRELVSRLAYQKAADVAARVDRGVVVGCDTVADCDGQILGKPRDEGDARRMLMFLRGREHRVLSGLCLWRRPDDQIRTGVAVTLLRMDAIADEVIEEYLDSRQWEGKAGAFGYQDRLGWVHVLQGTESNVVGLPLDLLAEMMADFAAGSEGE